MKLESLKAINYKVIDVVNFDIYSLFIHRVYDYSKASQLFGIGIPIGTLILAMAGASLPAPLAAIIASLAVGIEAGEVTVKLYETLGYFKVRFTFYDYTEIYYAEFTNTYMIKEEDDAERVVPLMIFMPKRY